MPGAFECSGCLIDPACMKRQPFAIVIEFRDRHILLLFQVQLTQTLSEAQIPLRTTVSDFWYLCHFKRIFSCFCIHLPIYLSTSCPIYLLLYLSVCLSFCLYVIIPDCVYRVLVRSISIFSVCEHTYTKSEAEQEREREREEEERERERERARATKIQFWSS